MELQQSILYKTYIESLGWSVATLDGTHIFYRNLPLLGVFAKIQRPETLPYLPKLIPFLRNLRVRSVAVDPLSTTDQEEFSQWMKSLKKFFPLAKEPFLPTKTILIDISLPEKEMFQRFSEAKRRAVRRAEKNGIEIIRSTDIDAFVDIKSKAAGMLGGMTTHGVKRMWNLYKNDHAAILFAKEKNSHEILGGVLLLFWEGIAYYWIAGATKKGKKLFVPTPLVWESLKEGKKHNCTLFDFVGVWDERMPKQNTAWLGFTKFKEGFGGTPLYYPIRNPTE